MCMCVCEEEKKVRRERKGGKGEEEERGERERRKDEGKIDRVSQITFHQCMKSHTYHNLILIGCQQGD